MGSNSITSSAPVQQTPLEESAVTTPQTPAAETTPPATEGGTTNPPASAGAEGGEPPVTDGGEQPPASANTSNTGSTVLTVEDMVGQAYEAYKSSTPPPTTTTTTTPAPTGDSRTDQMNQWFADATNAMNSNDAAAFDQAVTNIIEMGTTEEASPDVFVADTTERAREKEERRAEAKRENRAATSGDVLDDHVELTREQRQARADGMQQLADAYKNKQKQAKTAQERQFFTETRKTDTYRRMVATRSSDARLLENEGQNEAQDTRKKFALFEGRRSDRPQRRAKADHAAGLREDGELSPEELADQKGEYGDMEGFDAGNEKQALLDPKKAAEHARLVRERARARLGGGLETSEEGAAVAENGDGAQTGEAGKTAKADKKDDSESASRKDKKTADGKTPSGAQQPSTASCGKPVQNDPNAPLYVPSPAELAQIAAKQAAGTASGVLVEARVVEDDDAGLASLFVGENEDGTRIDDKEKRAGILGCWSSLFGGRKMAVGQRPAREQLENDAREEFGGANASGAVAGAGGKASNGAGGRAVAGTGGANQNTSAGRNARKPTFTTGDGYVFDLRETADAEDASGVDMEAAEHNAEQGRMAMARWQNRPRASAVVNPGNRSIADRVAERAANPDAFFHRIMSVCTRA